MHAIGGPKVALNFPRSAGAALSFARQVLASMKDNPAFVDAAPALAALEADIDSLSQAQAWCVTRHMGAAAARDDRLQAVRSDLVQLAQVVQRAATGNPLQALAVIGSSGFSPKRVGTRHKPELEIKIGPVSGTVLLVARAVAKQASYEWQWSSDGDAWTDLEPTIQANTTLSGLVAAKRYAFRVRGLYRGGRGDWSQVVWKMAE